jgi:tetratricopeptide (TPR) repeat protein
LKGDALSDKGLYNESAEAYRKALIYDPYALKSWTGLGRVSLELGQPEEAAAAFRKAINLDPADAALHEHLGDSLVAGDNFEEAIASYQKALAIHPKIPGVMEKMLAAKDALEGIPEKPDEPVLLEPGPAQAGPPQPAEPPETMTGETLSTQASLQGMVAVIAILFGSVLVVVRRK